MRTNNEGQIAIPVNPMTTKQYIEDGWLVWEWIEMCYANCAAKFNGVKKGQKKLPQGNWTIARVKGIELYGFEMIRPDGTYILCSKAEE